MPRALWLADALRAEGVTVTEHPGWRERGSSTFSPKGVICHHTAGPARGDAPSLGTCVNGRPGLPGPLCQIVLARSGTAIVIASGKANHAGAGGWRGLTGNTSVLGIEAENTGQGEPWPDAQYDAYVRVVAALCRHAAIPVGMVCGHKEWAPTRKIDPRGIDMAAFRAQVTTRLGATTPTTPHPPATEGFLMALTDDEQKELLAKVRSTDLRVQELDQQLTDGADAKKGGISRRILDSLARLEARKP